MSELESPGRRGGFLAFIDLEDSHGLPDLIGELVGVDWRRSERGKAASALANYLHDRFVELGDTAAGEATYVLLGAMDMDVIAAARSGVALQATVATWGPSWEAAMEARDKYLATGGCGVDAHHGESAELVLRAIPAAAATPATDPKGVRDEPPSRDLWGLTNVIHDAAQAEISAHLERDHAPAQPAEGRHRWRAHKTAFETDPTEAARRYQRGRWSAMPPDQWRP